MTFFGPEIGSGFGELRHTPTKNSQEYPPPPGKLSGRLVLLYAENALVLA